MWHYSQCLIDKSYQKVILGSISFQAGTPDHQFEWSVLRILGPASEKKLPPPIVQSTLNDRLIFQMIW